ncbi:MAG: response regulator [Spirochaetaceae bacterium]|jgi:CheY-like chemotaxis protein|nr:response regulator [Spirochaetaceae bacterium]
MQKKILYAEDEFTNRKIMEIQCRKAQVQCHLVEDGRTALKAARENLYDLIILDQYMPGLNGDTLAEQLRKEGINTPMIAITSDDEKKDYLRECGFDAIYIKPLRQGDYQGIIKKFIGESNIEK